MNFSFDEFYNLQFSEMTTPFTYKKARSVLSPIYHRYRTILFIHGMVVDKNILVFL